MQTSHRQKSATKQNHMHSLQLHISRFWFALFNSVWGFLFLLVFCCCLVWVFLSPPHFVIPTFWKSMRQKLFCQGFLNPLKILISLPPALANLFPLKQDDGCFSHCSMQQGKGQIYREIILFLYCRFPLYKLS